MHDAAWYRFTIVSEKLTASIFRVEETVGSSEMLVNFYQITLRYIPVDNIQTSLLSD